MTRPIYNFAAGPAMLPAPVLRQAQAELRDWQGRGLSVLEMPFTGEAYGEIERQARADLRRLLKIPQDYRILFMQGGASAQFALVPLNLLGRDGRADYIDTGHWSRKAITEGRHHCRLRVAASGAGQGYDGLPDPDAWRLDPRAGYCHITHNETADGLQFHHIPDTGAVPLVADMTSDLLSRPLDICRFGLVYAAAQKNIGPAGLTLVIVRDHLLRPARPGTPGLFDYRSLADNRGRLNTPPTYAVYLAGLVFRWLLDQGGLAAMAVRNRRQSERLYAAIDASDGYECPVRPADRSQMNHCFRLTDPAREADFLRKAEVCGLLNLGGHPARGGIRASLYNAMPDAGVEALIDYMAAFVDGQV
ncbi:3-phosphoserine/phosphohydroxythreonine transaminase [Marinobacterium aestuariivivens]|uniref:Phosphoserine aminotransferase n=1 Tax=Marinobacterium aestuariivivens TaxID=1698799 RepID=A0ABW1ZVE9_9GAMM